MANGYAFMDLVICGGDLESEWAFDKCWYQGCCADPNVRPWALVYKVELGVSGPKACFVTDGVNVVAVDWVSNFSYFKPTHVIVSTRVRGLVIEAFREGVADV